MIEFSKKGTLCVLPKATHHTIYMVFALILRITSICLGNCVRSSNVVLDFLIYELIWYNEEEHMEEAYSSSRRKYLFLIGVAADQKGVDRTCVQESRQIVWSNGSLSERFQEDKPLERKDQVDTCSNLC